MKFVWKPDLIAEIVRQVIPALVLFGVLQWTDVQIAASFAVLSAVLAFLTGSLTTPNAVLERAGTSRTQVVAAAEANELAGTPGGTGFPGEPGGAGGPSAPKGLGNFSDKGTRGLGILLAVVGIGAAGFSVSACGKRYAAHVPVQTRLAADMEAGLTQVVNTQEKVIAAVDANPSIKPQADRFLNPVRDLLQFSKAEVVPLLKAYDAAVTIADRDALKEKLLPLLQKFNTLYATAFGAPLPDNLVGNLAKLGEEIRKLFVSVRTEFALV